MTPRSEPLTPEQVVALLQGGRAEPLLPDHFPVPVLIDDRWWHLPDPRPGGRFEPAPPAIAALFTHQRTRLRAAHEAARRAGPGP